MKIVVDRDLCEGNARCVQAAPRVFRVDDADQVELLVEQPGEELRDAVETAVALCPRQALRVVDG
jgi:ferredoxin